MGRILGKAGFVGKAEGRVSPPVGRHPIMSHRNLKLQTSESAFSPASSHILASGHGTAVCLGALDVGSCTGPQTGIPAV